MNIKETLLEIYDGPRRDNTSNLLDGLLESPDYSTTSRKNRLIANTFRKAWKNDKFLTHITQN